eukprot:9479505-Pyramimonas_sp.AAC.1
MTPRVGLVGTRCKAEVAQKNLSKGFTLPALKFKADLATAKTDARAKSSRKVSFPQAEEEATS